MKEHRFKINDIVRVTEDKETYWKGKVMKIYTTSKTADIKDINPNSLYNKGIFRRFINNLTPWNSRDDVNI